MNKPHRTLLAATLLAATAMTPAHAGFFGPSKESLNAEQLQQQLDTRAVAIVRDGQPLEVASKGAAIAGFIASTVLSSALASGGGLHSGQSMQQWADSQRALSDTAMQVGQGLQQLTRDGLNALDQRSANQVAKDGPTAALTKSLYSVLSTRPNVVTELAPSAKALKEQQLELALTQTEWKLDFSMLSSDYTLSYKLNMSLLDPAADKLYLSNDCSGEYAKKMPKDDWEKDDYKAVNEALADIARSCHKQFATVLGLKNTDAPVGEPTPAAATQPVAATVPAAAAAPVAAPTTKL